MTSIFLGLADSPFISSFAILESITLIDSFDAFFYWTLSCARVVVSFWSVVGGVGMILAIGEVVRVVGRFRTIPDNTDRTQVRDGQRSVSAPVP